MPFKRRDSLIWRLLKLTLGLVLVQNASAAIFLEEAFPYATGNLSGKGSWSGGSGAQIVSGSLSYPDLQIPSVSSNKVSLPSTASTAVKVFNAGPVFSDSVYISFILKQTTLAASTTGGTLAGLDDDGTVTTSNGRVAAALGIHLKQTAGSRYFLGIRKGQGTTGAGGGSDVFYTGESFAVNDIVFVVARYTFGASTGDDTVTLWVNPGAASFGSVEPAPSIAATASGNTADAASLQYIFVRCNSSTATGVNEIDNFRVGTAWTDVTPGEEVVPPPPLKITQSLLVPGGFVLRGAGGSANGIYQVLSSADVAAPVNQWISIATNSFDANGNFDCTNSILGGAAQFYRLLVGGVSVSAPTITNQPLSQTNLVGQTVTFSVEASGTTPLQYQWFFNTNTPLANATSSFITLTNIQATNAGGYSVRISNSGGTATSVVATLTVLVPPTINFQPQDQTNIIGNDVTLSVTATGTAPLRYQWYFNTNTPLLNATNFTLTLTNAQSTDAGYYFVIVTNSVGSITSQVAMLTVIPPSTNAFNFNLFGFATGATGGGIIAETNSNYRKVYTPDQLRLALVGTSVKVIEIMNDLNLGWNEIPAGSQTGAFRQNLAPSLHPALIASGVSLIDIQDKNGLTIFSANGSTIRHAELNVKRCNNLLIRNLRFDELWEWDEADKGDYDSKDWDFITVDMDSNQIWVDHCDFTKAYDGVVDVKGGSHNVTISWCRFLGDTGGPNSFVRQQIEALEQNSASYPMYNFLRTKGFSVEDIIAVVRSQKKGHLVGATEFSVDNASLSVTLHHNYYLNFQDRIPRLRGGNAHAYNIYVNNSEALAARRLRDQRVAAMNATDAAKLNGSAPTYKFTVTLNGAISTEDGAVLVEKSHLVDVTSPIRNNQTDPADPTYTGKIRALDTIYTLDASTFRGGSEDVGSPLAPVPAPVKPFSFNGYTTLPYSYELDDPATLADMLSGNQGPGSGVIFWAKTNWLKISY